MSLFDDLGKALAGVAPALAGALGTAVAGPVGGALARTAVGAIGEALGLDTDDPKAVSAALVTATPEQIAAIKRADQAFAARMRELDLHEVEIHACDRDAVAIPTNQTRVDCTPAAAESDRPLGRSVKVLEMEAKSGVKSRFFAPATRVADGGTAPLITARFGSGGSNTPRRRARPCRNQYCATLLCGGTRRSITCVPALRAPRG